jgi:NTE family protein
MESLDTLVLSGGAIRGFAILGGIQYLQDQKVLGHIRKYIGTSIGAIIGYLICIGYTPVEIMVALTTQYAFLDKLYQFDILNVLNGGGATSFSIVQDVLEKLTIQKIGRFITMQDLLTEFGKVLICCTYNKTQGQIEYISHKTQPNIPCLVALRMTASLPFLFDPFVYNGCVYIDGGILDNLPLTPIDESDHILAIRIKSARMDHHDTFMERIMDILSIPISYLENLRIQNVSMPFMLIEIEVQGHCLQMSLNTTEKFDMFSLGYNSLRVYFE